MAQRSASSRRAGFTLVELLLVVVMLLLLMGAMVFNFNRLQTGAGLDEGALRLQTLLRLAEAEAAQSGRRVQLQFLPDEDPESLFQLQSVALVWELDPLQHPGVFRKIEHGSWNLAAINDVIGVDQVLTQEPAAPPPARPVSAGSELSATAESAIASGYPPLTFYPDGTSDSIRLILAARDPEDPRRRQLTWEGLTGSVTLEPLFSLSSTEQITGNESAQTNSVWRDPTGRETEFFQDNAN